MPYSALKAEYIQKKAASMTDMTVVFDLDGTLIDTAPDLVASLNHVISHDGLEPLTYDDLTYLVGHGARVMIERAFTLRGVHLAPARHDEMLEDFITHYRKNMPGKSQPYPGLVEALHRLSEAGITLAVCTNKMESLARPLLAELKMDHMFSAITGGDSFFVRKPDARHLLETIRLAHGVPEKAIMIGDSLNDILVARNAQVRSVAVPFGYSDVPVEDLEPDHILTHFNQLTPNLVKQLLG
jgi:phosphoglycolate phosphatase